MQGKILWRIIATALILIGLAVFLIVVKPPTVSAQGPVPSWHGTLIHGAQGINGGTVATSAWQMLCGRGACYQNPETGTWIHESGQLLHVYGTEGNPVTGMVARPGQVASKVERGCLEPAIVPTSVKLHAAAGAWATAVWEMMPKSEVGLGPVAPGWLPYCPFGAAECLERFQNTRVD